MMVGIAFTEILLVAALLGSSPLSLPLSLPPLPEDPVLSQIAPEECLWYLSWNGVAKADPKSPNHTEQLIAEEEVQRFLGEIEARLRDALRKGAPQNPQGAELANQASKLIAAFVKRPMAVYIESVTITPQGPGVRGGLVLSGGDQADEIRAAIEQIESTLLTGRGGAVPTGGGTPGKANDPQAAGKSKWRKLPTPPGAPEVEYGWQEKYLIVGFGAGSADEIAARFTGATPNWLANIKKQLKVERPAMLHFLNLQQIRVMAQSALAVQGINVFGPLGLNNVMHYASVSGLEGEGSISRTQIATKSKPSGILALMGDKPLQASDLARIPKDATIAAAARIDADRVFNEIQSTVAKIDRRAGEEMRRELAEMEKHLGLSISGDILKSLGDVWTLSSAPSEGGILITGLTLTVSVKDRAKLVAVHDKLVASARSADAAARQGLPPGARRRGVEIADFDFHGQKIFFANFIGEEVPFAPAWCITDSELIVAPFPQMIKARLSRGSASGSLADVPDVAKALRSSTPPTGIVYQDTATIFRTVYPFVHMLASFACGELQREGIDIDVSLLPSAAAIEKHLRVGVTMIHSANDGVYLTSTDSLPIATAALPMALGPAMFFTMARSRVVHVKMEEARAIRDVARATEHVAAVVNPAAAARQQSVNNLRMIGLALHNFHETHKRLPRADGFNANGRAGLSWRVQILPFLEEDTLFREFRQDEPWDSEHNKKLIEKMPAVFKVPGSKKQADFKTNYVTVRGKDTMFPAGGSTRIRDVKDGLSKTAMVVEADDDHAVIWTKPDDFEPNDEDPIAGLVGLRDASVLACFGDGSTHVLPKTLPKETIRALFTRNGGETFHLDN